MAVTRNSLWNIDVCNIFALGKS